ncbi:MAG: hypothetical protein L3K15_05355 [Thermoplasmata archaeon]|nr:hypothetical protein [Thermoplasmata archaeon]
MVDRVYKADIPALRKALEDLREEFSHLGSTTDWAKLRIEPLLEHARTLERLLKSRTQAHAASRLRRGVEMFHADLVYLRTNVRGLRTVLRAEKRLRPRR